MLGRYAIHFHACDDGSAAPRCEASSSTTPRGTFASHLSNGVTFRECIAHDIVDDAFWWDLSLDGGGRDLVPSDDIFYDRSVAHLVRSGANSRFNLSGFMMGAGNGNMARGCVAAVQGEAESSAGFHWPSHSRTRTRGPSRTTSPTTTATAASTSGRTVRPARSSPASPATTATRGSSPAPTRTWCRTGLHALREQ